MSDSISMDSHNRGTGSSSSNNNNINNKSSSSSSNKRDKKTEDLSSSSKDAECDEGLEGSHLENGLLPRTLFIDTTKNQREDASAFETIEFEASSPLLYSSQDGRGVRARKSADDVEGNDGTAASANGSGAGAGTGVGVGTSVVALLSPHSSSSLSSLNPSSSSSSSSSSSTSSSSPPLHFDVQDGAASEPFHTYQPHSLFNVVRVLLTSAISVSELHEDVVDLGQQVAELGQSIRDKFKRGRE